MSYTDYSNIFQFDRKLSYQDFGILAANDAFLKTNFTLYRRPVIRRQTSSSPTIYWIEAEPNSTDGTTTVIMFPDGNVRTVSESRSFVFGTTQYVAFGINPSGGGITGASLSGTKLGGYLSGVGGPPTNNGWGFCYAAKATDDATKFVMIATTLAPIRANVASLNSGLGTNGWVYLGAFRTGENGANTNKILNFAQSGNITVFKEAYAAYVTGDQTLGFAIAADNSSATATYATALGVGNLNIPNNFTHVMYGAICNVLANKELKVQDSGATRGYAGGGVSNHKYMAHVLTPVNEGIKITVSATATKEIAVVGWIDGALGIGANPLI